MPSGVVMTSVQGDVQGAAKEAHASLFQLQQQMLCISRGASASPSMTPVSARR